MIATGLVEVYLDGAWVDVTDRVDDAMQDVSSAHGRQTVLVDPDPSVMTLVLRNDDHELTPGNASSSYYPFFDAGAPIRWTEVLAATLVYHFNGKLEMPQVATMWDEGDEETGTPPRAHEVVAVSCVDDLAKLDGAREFVSTLTEHIRSAGGTSLVHFWPLHDAAPPFTGVTPGTKPMNVMADPAGFLPAEMDPPPGDDAPVLQLSPTRTDAGGFTMARAVVSPTVVATSTAGDTVALSFWTNRQAPPAGTTASAGYLATATDALGSTLLYVAENALLGTLDAGAGVFPDVAFPAAPAGPPVDLWRLITIRITLATGVVELWVADNDPVTTTIGSPPATLSIDKVEIGPAVWAGISRLQLYRGPGAMTRAQHLEQMQAGLLGFELQSVSDRIEMVAGFAGVDPADLDIDASSTQMQVCRLAGVAPGAAMRNAATADQGLLFTVPSGKLTFQSRKHRYYSTDTPADIPYEWLGAPLLWRRDRPLNAAAVTQNGAGTAYGIDQASIDQYRQGPFAATLDTAIAADAAALAAFIIEFFASPRSRIDSMTFALDFFTEEEQLLLTTIAIGQRISITGAPGHWPEGGPQASVEGRQMQSSNGVRTLALKCAPIVGSVPGTPGPWFTLGTSELGGPDIVPF